MVAGGAYHDAPVPVDGGALTTARQNLRTQYAFVGALERQRESLCVLSALLGRGHAEGVGGPAEGPDDTREGERPGGLSRGLRRVRRAGRPALCRGARVVGRARRGVPAV